jgi:hypothetical protein
MKNFRGGERGRAREGTERKRQGEIQKGRRQRERVDCNYLLQSVRFEANRSEYFEASLRK